MYIRNLFNNLDYEINMLHIYNENGVIFETVRNFETTLIDGEKLKTDYATGDIYAVDFGEIRNARTINFNKKDCFFVKRRDAKSYQNNTDLYIHTNFINAVFVGEKIASQLKDETNYLRVFELTFKTVTLRKRNFEKIPLNDGENWTLPDGAHFSDGYGTIEKPCFGLYDYKKSRLNSKDEHGVIKRWLTYETETNKSVYVTAPFYSKTIYSKERLNAQKIADDLNEKRVFHNHVSYYEIERLLKYYDLKPKKGVTT